jgi:hypothetical protein
VETATLDRLPGPGLWAFEAAWEDEWERHVLDMALG